MAGFFNSPVEDLFLQSCYFKQKLFHREYQQTILIPYTVDILKTLAKLGLTSSNIDISIIAFIDPIYQ